jgi:hypothetical protein
MITQSNDLHVADDVLVRIVDDEVSAHEHAYAHTHLETCSVCTERLSTISRRTHALSALLQVADPGMPLMQPPSPSSAALPQTLRASRRRYAVPVWLKAAAVVLLIAGAAVMASPVRARVLDWIRDAFRPPASAPAVMPTDRASAGHASVEFLPVGNELNLEVVDAEAGGELRIGMNDGRAVVARARNATSAVELVVLPAGLRIVNTAARATYDISVPAQITRIRVQIGQDAPLELEPAQLPRVILFGAQPDGPGNNGGSDPR